MRSVIFIASIILSDGMGKTHANKWEKDKVHCCIAFLVFFIVMDIVDVLKLIT